MVYFIATNGLFIATRLKAMLGLDGRIGPILDRPGPDDETNFD
jgi:hypothetical protein